MNRRVTIECKVKLEQPEPYRKLVLNGRKKYVVVDPKPVDLRMSMLKVR